MRQLQVLRVRPILGEIGSFHHSAQVLVLGHDPRPRRYLQAFEQRQQQRVAGDLVDPGRLLADDVSEQGEGGQPAGLFGHALVHLVQKVLRVREGGQRVRLFITSH